VKHDCSQQTALEMIISRLDKIDNNVEKLLKFKWQATTVTAVIASMISAIWVFILTLFAKS
jgi:hypothetical protein